MVATCVHVLKELAHAEYMRTCPIDPIVFLDICSYPPAPRDQCPSTGPGPQKHAAATHTGLHERIGGGRTTLIVFDGKLQAPAPSRTCPVAPQYLSSHAVDSYGGLIW